jgi:hypothetical protein
MKNNAVLEVYKLDMEAAGRVAQRFVLQEIFLVDAKISRDPLIESPEALSLKHKCYTEMFEFDEEKAIQFIRCIFQVAAFDGKEPNKLIMKIEASFGTSYVEKSQPDPLIPEDDGSPEIFFNYLRYRTTINPISDAWPYWREFLQSMSSRMGFSALTVPLLEIVPKKADTQEAKSQPGKKESTRRKKVIA